jgi:hypothetical protein
MFGRETTIVTAVNIVWWNTTTSAGTRPREFSGATLYRHHVT